MRDFASYFSIIISENLLGNASIKASRFFFYYSYLSVFRAFLRARSTAFA